MTIWWIELFVGNAQTEKHLTQSPTGKKMVTGTFTSSSEHKKTITTLIKTNTKALKFFYPAGTSTCKNFAKTLLSFLFPQFGCIRFARDCGKMYCRYLFMNSGLCFSVTMPIKTDPQVQVARTYSKQKDQQGLRLIMSPYLCHRPLTGQLTGHVSC